jgi:porphobilinogen deaminase
MSTTQKTITIGTRKSKLALLQTNLVLDALKKAFPQYEYKIFSKETAGDLNTTIALRDFNTKNLWTEELEELMIDGQVDVIVHSLKGLLISQFQTAYLFQPKNNADDDFEIIRCPHYAPLFLQARSEHAPRR